MPTGMLLITTELNPIVRTHTFGLMVLRPSFFRFVVIFVVAKLLQKMKDENTWKPSFKILATFEHVDGDWRPTVLHHRGIRPNPDPKRPTSSAKIVSNRMPNQGTRI